MNLPPDPSMTLQIVSNYGPLLIFFVAVGFIVYKWAPPIFATFTQLFREMIAALQASTIAINNSTTALDQNSEAAVKHHEVMQGMNILWKEMQSEIARLRETCPINNPPRSQQAMRSVRLVSNGKPGNDGF